MSEKHTPGPWRVTHRHVHAAPHDDEIGGLGWELEGPPEPMRGHFALAADAHLVAAAPDLLASLKNARFLIGKLAGWNGVDLNELDEEYDGMVAGIDAAIARAEGGGS